MRVNEQPPHDPLLSRGVITMGMAMVVITMTAFFRVPLLPDLGRDLGMSIADLGVLTTVFAAGRLLIDIPAGRLADRMRPSRMMANSAVVIGGGSFLLAAAPGSAIAYAGSFLLGVGSALANTTGMTYFSRTVSVARRGTSVSIFAAGLLVGQALGPTLGGAVAAAGGWRLAEVVAGVIAVAVATTLVGVTRAPRAGGSGPTSAEATQPQVPLRFRVVLYMVPFAMFGAMGSLTQTLIPIIGDDDLGLSASSIGLAVGVGGLCRLIGSIVGGQLSDRVSRKSALVPGLLAQAGGVALLAAGSSIAIWLTSIIVMGFSSLGIGVSATMLADLSRGSRVGRQLGPFRFVGDLGLIAAPVAAAWLFQTHGVAAAVLPLAGLLAATGIAVALFLPETRWLEEERPAPA
jgi:predicted MFS family arabinose efflux permease